MRSVVIALFVGACATTPAATFDRTDCNRCHASDYDTTPSQVGACKPTDHSTYARTCSDCHGTTSWCPADANHFQFRLSGNHAGWDCADCHQSISYDPVMIAPQPITCTNCHWHEQSRTDPIHLGNGDYSYAPASCLECHSGGGR